MNDSIHNSSSVYNVSSDILQLHVKVLSATACAINLALGVPTNIYVLWLMVTGTKAALASEFFSLNLTLAESIGSLLGLLWLLNRYGYAFQGFFKGVDLFCFTFAIAGRPLFLCLICVERYLAVVHPVTYLKAKPLRYKVASSGLAWLSILSASVSCLLLSDSIVTLHLCTVSYSVCFAIKMFCSLAILWTLRRNGPGERHSSEMNNVKLKAFRIVLVIMASVAINYIPTLVFFVRFHSMDPNELFFANSILFSLSGITGFVNPLLYLHRVGKMSCDCRAGFPN